MIIIFLIIIQCDEMMISLEERYENLKKTIQECGSYLLTESDDTIKHNLFEEFSIDAFVGFQDPEEFEFVDKYLNEGNNGK